MIDWPNAGFLEASFSEVSGLEFAHLSDGGICGGLCASLKD